MPVSDPPKLHLNEHLSPRLAIQLCKRGFDVSASHESQLLSSTDAEQLEFAVSEQRAILTFNVRDFTVLHFEYISSGKNHWGIILSTQEGMNILFHRILRLLNSVTASELINQIRWLNEFK